LPLADGEVVRQEERRHGDQGGGHEEQQRFDRRPQQQHQAEDGGEGRRGQLQRRGQGGEQPGEREQPGGPRCGAPRCVGAALPGTTPDRAARAAYRANTAQQAAGVWLLSVTANVVTNVPKQATATAKTRPRSVVPKRSTSRASSSRQSSHGSALTVSS